MSKSLNTHQRRQMAWVKDIIEEPYAWPGGYDRFMVMTDGGVLCSKCVSKERRYIYEEIKDPHIRGGWAPAGIDYTDNVDDPLMCDNCNQWIVAPEDRDNDIAEE